MKHQKEYNKMLEQLDKLIESSKKDILNLKEKIKNKDAEYQETNDIINKSYQKKKFGNDAYMAAMFALKNAPILTDAQEELLNKKSDLLEKEIARDKKVFEKMVKSHRTLEALKSTCSQDGNFSELEEKLSQAKTQICSEENKDLFSKHSDGYDWFSKIVAFFNSVFTKTIGEKNIDKIEKGLDKASSIAQKLSAQGIFKENGKTESGKNENEYSQNNYYDPDSNPQEKDLDPGKQYSDYDLRYLQY